MIKFFVILAFFAFTQNVKAANQYLDWDFTAAEGEDITVERVIALQFAKGEWDENTTNMWDYLLNGQNMRVYRHIVDDIDQPQDYYIYTAVGHKYYDDLLHIYYIDYSIDRQYESDLTVGELIDRIIQLNTSEYRLLSAVSNDGQTETYSNVKYTQQGWTVGEDDNGEYLNLGSTVSSPALDDYGNNASSVAQVLTDDSLRKSLLQYASIPLNDVKITITNSAGQVTSQHDYTSYLVSIQSLLGQVNSNLTDLKNALGFSGSSSDNLSHFLGQWRTTDGINQGNILNSITNANSLISSILNYYVRNYGSSTNGYHSIPHNVYDLLFNSTSGNSFFYGDNLFDAEGFSFGQDYLPLYSSQEKFSFQVDSFLLNQMEWIWSALKSSQYIDCLTNSASSLYSQQYWLNNATNDLNSFTYWLNQQTFTQKGTNDVSAAQQKFDAITNQYAQISLVGANASNSAQNWDYFKRLEMLLAALVYKQTDYEGTIDSHESGNNASVSSSVSSGEDQINTSLTAVKDALTLSTIGGAKNTIVSLFQTATSAFDVNGSKRVINVMETDVAGGNEGAGITVNLDFTQGELGDFADFVHHLFGFLWGFGSLFIFWRVCKFCWDMGYKVVKFHYSLCRKFLGI